MAIVFVLIVAIAGLCYLCVTVAEVAKKIGNYADTTRRSRRTGDRQGKQRHN